VTSSVLREGLPPSGAGSGGGGVAARNLRWYSGITSKSQSSLIDEEPHINDPFAPPPLLGYGREGGTNPLMQRYGPIHTQSFNLAIILFCQVKDDHV